MYILGVSAFYHDSAVALIKDGRIVWAAAEERFSRVKHDNRFPSLAIERCLSDECISLSDIEAIAYYEKPLRKFERILQMFVDTYPRSLRAFVEGLPEWLSRKMRIEHILRKELGFEGRIYYVPHHLSHASSAFYTSPFKESAILTVDGVGEYQTTALWLGRGTEIHEIASLHFPNSLGLFYSTCTAYLGYRVNEDESKIMGLAAFGTPLYEREMRDMLRLSEDGAFGLSMQYFAFREGRRMWTRAFERALGPSREPGSRLDERTKNIASSLQLVLEDAYTALARRAKDLTGSDSLCIAGGVALNASANGKLESRSGFAKLHIPGPAGDDGAAAGAALYAFHGILKRGPRHHLQTLDLGTAYSNESIKEAVGSADIHFEYLDTDALFDRVSTVLSKGAIVGWFRGRMEYGPRALGHRSILASPADVRMKSRINRLKGRDAEHPCAGSVLAESAATVCDISEFDAYAFMTLSVPMTAESRTSMPAVAHADGTCRIQTVRESDYRTLIEYFHKKTGLPCLLNTSFNLRGEPIVESPAQAIHAFLVMEGMDYMVLENYLITKKSHTEVSPAQ